MYTAETARDDGFSLTGMPPVLEQKTSRNFDDDARGCALRFFRASMASTTMPVGSLRTWLATPTEARVVIWSTAFDASGLYVAGRVRAPLTHRQWIALSRHDSFFHGDACRSSLL